MISKGMTYKYIIQQLEGRERFGFIFGLERISKFLKGLNHPEKRIKTIHITGTNGKGSTASFIAKILESSGYKVGLYTSPHLVDIRERIKINRFPIQKKEFVRLYSQLSVLEDKRAQELTYFEFLTAMAFQYFYEKKVDFLVLEAGLGGRLDATNVVNQPLVTLITNVDYEHTEYLGNTLTKIAYEKAGIIKKNSITITGIKQKNILSFLKIYCAERKNQLFALGKDFQATGFRLPVSSYQEFNYTGIFGRYHNLRIKLPGKHQTENASLAIAAIEALRSRNIFISEQAIRKGLESTFWPGRLEILRLLTGKLQPVTVVLDGAHNPAGMKILRNSLTQLKRDKVFFILGILADKDIPQMIKEIIPVIDYAVITKPDYYRAGNPEVLRQELGKYLDKNRIFLKLTVEKALNFALRQIKTKNRMIVISGSLYTVGEAKRAIAKWEKRKYLIPA